MKGTFTWRLNPPVNRQNDCVLSARKKRDIDENCLVVERSKFAKRVMVSAGVFHGGMGRLKFLPDKATLNATLYLETLLSRDHWRLQVRFTVRSSFQQDGAIAHTVKLAQDFLTTNCSEFTDKDKWPPNSPDLNPFDYYVWEAMLEQHRLQDISSQAKEHRRAEACLASNMGPTASSLNQQGHSAFKKNSSVLESWGWTLWICFAINLKRCFSFQWKMVLLDLENYKRRLHVCPCSANFKFRNIIINQL